MSLINKMLQDLDARGSQGGSALQSEIKPVATPERKLPVAPMAILGGVAVLAMAAAGLWWLKREPAPPAVVVLANSAPPPAAAPSRARIALTPEKAAANTPPVAAPAAPAAAAAEVSPKIIEPASAAPPKVTVAKVVRIPALERPAKVLPPSAPLPLAGGRDMNDAQRSETQYRNALAALDDGRTASAMGMLEQALKLNPRHDAARQSLVALLIEAGRNDEAMQQLEQGLAIDAAQPSLAMLLARMQIERGTSGVATLLRTLPSAGGNADYHAFLAGALQREQRHREAVVQYAAALGGAPDNGVWLMGLGISLQAEKRNGEALDAFKRSRASGMLTAPLAAFVDRKILQLTP